MTKEELQQLYSDKILVHGKDPYHFEKIAYPDVEILAYNPMCGDKYVLQLVKGDDSIQSAYFDGFGCALSKASISILLRKIEGMSIQDAAAFCKDFIHAIDSGSGIPSDDPALNVLLELRNFEGRVDCIKLGWESLLSGLGEES